MKDFVSCLLEKEVEINYFNPITNTTPIHLAVKKGRLDILKLLLEKSVDVNITDKDGRTPLHFLIDQWEKISEEDWDKYLELLKSKLDLELFVKNNDGMSPVDLAISRGLENVVNKLLPDLPNIDISEEVRRAIEVSI